MSALKDLAGQKFGRLTAQWPEGKTHGSVVWLCLCICGVLRHVNSNGLLKQKSCGCINAEGQNAVTHGQSKGGIQTAEYKSFSNAKNRCTNPNNDKWKYYGGRGIQFKFVSFEEFLAALGKRPEGFSLDRINTNGHYEPGNVRWATRKEQSQNRRKKGEL